MVRKKYDHPVYDREYRRTHKAEINAYMRDYMRTYRALHPEYNRQKALRRKIRCFEKLGGAKCVGCGCEDARILEVNHINGRDPDDRSHGPVSRRKWLGDKLYSAILNGIYDKPLSGLNVLCKVCNQADYVKRKWGIEFEIRPKP